MFTLYLFFILLATTTLFIFPWLHFGTWVLTKMTGRNLRICLCWDKLRSLSNWALSQLLGSAGKSLAARCPLPVLIHSVQNPESVPLDLTKPKNSTFAFSKHIHGESKLSSSPAQKYLAMYKFHANKWSLQFTDHNLQTVLEVSFKIEINHLLIPLTINSCLCSRFPFILPPVIMLGPFLSVIYFSTRLLISSALSQDLLQVSTSAFLPTFCISLHFF